MKLSIKKILLFLILSYFSTNAFSQVSGYMGKRFIARFDTYTNIYFPSQNRRNYPINNFPIRKNISIDYVIGRNLMLGFSYIFSNTQFHYENYFGQMTNSGFGVALTLYVNGIAPVGKYTQLKLNYINTDYSIRVED